jgi:predicted SprT family Zn-dependent metalloprotease
MNEATLRSHWRALQNEHPELRAYRLELGRGVKVFGTCSYKDRVIKVSKHHLRESPDELVLNTLRHEAAHALAGPGAGHGWKWKREAVRLGAKPVRCHSETLKVTERRAVGYYTCDANCGAKQMLVVKKPKYDASNYRCGRCKSTVTYHQTEEEQ